MKRRYYIFMGVIMLMVANCTKPYTPKAITSVNNYLVVEGIINTGAGDSTVILLSRTIPLDAGPGVKTESNATVTIQSDNSQSFSLTETHAGIYTSANLTLDNSHKYRLNITTSDGVNYQSDYLSPKITPPIDSVGYAVKSNGMQVYVNTHDPANSTHYYRWDYTETWKFHSEYESEYLSNGSMVVQRTPDQQIYQCWSSGLSNDILLGSSAKLTQDVIYQSPLTFVESTSEKVELRYSILVKQYALTSDGYSYFDQLRKNTEELGGIFDPQPSELNGNLHCTSNAAIPVIGYITAGTIQQKRVFIDKAQLPVTWNTKYPYNCENDSALFYNPKTKANDVSLYLLPQGSSAIITSPIFSITNPSPNPIGYMYSDRDCADCTVRGTTVQPSFWK